MTRGPGAPVERVRVAIDVTSLAGERTGVGHVTAAIVEHLAARPDVALVGYMVTGNRAHAASVTLPAGVPRRMTGVPARVLFRAWPRVALPPIDWWTGRVDVVHGTNFVVPPTRAGALVTVHDLAFLTRPEVVTAASRAYGELLRAAIRRGATVHAFSDAVARDAVELLDCPAERVVVIRPGIADTTGGDAAAGRRRAGAATYVLALGTVEPRKNYPRLVAAFDRVAADRADVRLVIAGGAGWGADALDAAVRAATHGDRVVRLGYVSDTDRRDLLAGAAVLAYPSLDEGFGHPPLEAMQVGVPVVAAHAGALPEVLDDAAVLVDPTSEAALADALTSVLVDPSRRADLVARGHERVTRYSWAATADALVACYRDLRAR